MIPTPLDSFMAAMFFRCKSVDLPVSLFSSTAKNTPFTLRIRSGIPLFCKPPPQTLKYQPLGACVTFWIGVPAAYTPSLSSQRLTRFSKSFSAAIVRPAVALQVTDCRTIGKPPRIPPGLYRHNPLQRAFYRPNALAQPSHHLFFSFNQPGCPCVFRVFRQRDPFQLRSAAIVFIAALMVYDQFSVRVWNKRRCHHNMHSYTSAVDFNAKVPAPIVIRIQYGFVFCVPHPAQGGYLIIRVIAYRLPAFFTHGVTPSGSHASIGQKCFACGQFCDWGFEFHPFAYWRARWSATAYGKTRNSHPARGAYGAAPYAFSVCTLILHPLSLPP